MFGASGLSDDDDVKNDGISPLVHYRHFVAAFCNCHYQRAPPPPPTGLIFYSQTGRLTESVWGGRFGLRGRATMPPTLRTDSE